MKKKYMIFIISGIVLLLGLFFYFNNRYKKDYIHINQPLTICNINENEIEVEGNGYDPDFPGRYIIKNNEDLIIYGTDGNTVSIDSLKVGDVLLIDFTGAANVAPKDGTIINESRKFSIYNIRLADEENK